MKSIPGDSLSEAEHSAALATAAALSKEVAKLQQDLERAHALAPRLTVAPCLLHDADETVSRYIMTKIDDIDSSRTQLTAQFEKLSMEVATVVAGSRGVQNDITKLESRAAELVAVNTLIVSQLSTARAEAEAATRSMVAAQVSFVQLLPPES